MKHTQSEEVYVEAMKAERAFLKLPHQQQSNGAVDSSTPVNNNW
jgi:hypothetical protein